MNDLKLVTLVRNHPELYDKTNTYFKCPERKKNVWQFIGNELNASDDICRRRWLALRDRYGREVRKNIDPTAYKTWHLLEAMEFMKIHIVARPTRLSHKNDMKYADDSSSSPRMRSRSPPSITGKLPLPTRQLMPFDAFEVSIPSPATQNAVLQSLKLDPLIEPQPPSSPALMESPTYASSFAVPMLSPAASSSSDTSSASDSPACTQIQDCPDSRKSLTIENEIDRSMLEALEIFKKRCLARVEQKKEERPSATHSFAVMMEDMLAMMSETKQAKAMRLILDIVLNIQQEAE